MVWWKWVCIIIGILCIGGFFSACIGVLCIWEYYYPTKQNNDSFLNNCFKVFCWFKDV